MLAVPTPEAPQATCTLARPAIPPSPLRDRVGYSDHVRFRGYFPVHFIPAYNLPVYASQWPLPDTTQDSVRGCSLGFTAAAISGDRVQRTCTAQPAQIRTCPIRAYGSHLWVDDGETLILRLTVCAPASVTRLSGSVPGPCFAGSHSPRPPPFAPPAPLRSGPLCSSASQLLWRSLTSRDRASSATAPRLPDADRRQLPNGRS